MFPRIKKTTSKGYTYEYLQIVESFRDSRGQPRQRVVATLGRVDQLDPVAIDRLAGSLAKYGTGGYRPERPEKPRGVDSPGFGVREHRSFGGVYALERLWKELGLKRLFQRLARKRRFRFDLERATFCMVANRLLAPKSKLSVETWLDEDVYIDIESSLTADQFYKTLGWLEDVKDDVEGSVLRLLRRQNRVNGVFYFYDTTLTWFEGAGPPELARRTKRKRAMRGKHSILVGLVTSANGWPIHNHVFRGTEADVNTMKETLRHLREVLRLHRIVIITDRGMISAEVIGLLEELKYEYILATKLRNDLEVRDDVLARAGRYREVDPTLGVKEVWVDHRRYVVCRNREEIELDQLRRAEIVGALEKRLGEGVPVKSAKAAELRANGAFRKFVKIEGDQLVLDRDAMTKEKRYDGRWVLRTNLLNLPAEEVARLYKQEAFIERDFRDIKSFIGLRPVRHFSEDNVRGHVLICTIAKLMMRALAEKLGYWPESVEGSVESALRELKRIRVDEHVYGPEGQETAPTLWVRSYLTSTQRALLETLGIKKLPAVVSPPSRLPAAARERTAARRRKRRRAKRES